MLLLGTGRTADVHALDEDWALRRHRNGGDAEREAATMRRVAACGYPVPRVLRAEGRDLVLQRLRGESLLDAALGGKVAPEAAGELSADLLNRLHATTPVVHLDLHPGNVMLTPDGPMVIDWVTAEEGPAGLDCAMSAILLAEPAVSALPLAAAARRALAALLIRLETPVLPYLPAALTRRAADPYLTATEAADAIEAAALVAELTAGLPTTREGSR
ncbi:phosphotransferase [Streptomyces sp. HUAS MG47]|uniref:phosphotransferase n=1 Tax=Streptomyces solicamelliae TaxID=3231716 RepID=UPI003877AF4E